MGQKSMHSRDSAEQTVRAIRRKTRKQYSAEEKIRIVLAGLRGEDSIAELCRREGIAESLYYSWSKEFLEAGKKRLSGDTARQASSSEVRELRREMRGMKELVADLTLENRLLKKRELYAKLSNATLTRAAFIRFPFTQVHGPYVSEDPPRDMFRGCI